MLLTDFGIAKLLEGTQQERTNAHAGTPEYMAPEQIQKMCYSICMDEYRFSVSRFSVHAMLFASDHSVRGKPGQMVRLDEQIRSILYYVNNDRCYITGESTT